MSVAEPFDRLAVPPTAFGPHPDTMCMQSSNTCANRTGRRSLHGPRSPVHQRLPHLFRGDVSEEASECTSSGDSDDDLDVGQDSLPRRLDRVDSHNTSTFLPTKRERLQRPKPLQQDTLPSYRKKMHDFTYGQFKNAPAASSSAAVSPRILGGQAALPVKSPSDFTPMILDEHPQNPANTPEPLAKDLAPASEKSYGVRKRSLTEPSGPRDFTAARMRKHSATGTVRRT